MPGFDGTGPLGGRSRTGRGRGPCRNVMPSKVPQEETNALEQTQATPLYSLGRGGISCGCGRGFGGGRFRSPLNQGEMERNP